MIILICFTTNLAYLFLIWVASLLDDNLFLNKLYHIILFFGSCIVNFGLPLVLILIINASNRPNNGLIFIILLLANWKSLHLVSVILWAARRLHHVFYHGTGFRGTK